MILNRVKMDETALCAIIMQSVLFQGLDGHACQKILAAGRRVPLAEGTILFNQGDEAVTFYVVIEGYIRLVQVNPEGHQMTVNYVGQGGSIGIIVALSAMGYPVSAEIIQGGTAMAWNRSTIRQIMLDYPQLALNGLNVMANYFVNLQHRYHELAAERVERRVARALLRLVRQAGRKIEQGILIDIPLSRQDLAEMTGTTLFTVSRILKAWEQQGFVLAEREKVTIRQPHRLVVIAEDLPDPNVPGG